MKIVCAAIVLIAGVLIAAPYLGFNPVLPVFALLGLGIYGVCRGAPVMTRVGRGHWPGSGIYYDRDDVWVEGQESDATYDVNDGAPRKQGDRAKR